jgi:nitrite reductase/ring-hydroxylating ferredoxin subunit
MNAYAPDSFSRSIVDVEKDLWEGYWHLFCHRSEVAAPHEYVRLQAFGDEVVAFNDGADVVVFDNRCPHRGARVYDGDAGKQRWVCPYHGWSFVKGRFFVPASETFTGCDPTKAELARYRTAWVGEFLFVSKRPTQPIETQLEGVYDMLAAISRGIGGRRDINAYPYRCNWKIAVENALDQYHVSLVHHETLNRLKLKPAEDEYLGENNISRAALGDEKMIKKLKLLGRLFELDHKPDGYVAIQLFPFTFLTSTFGYSYSLQQFYPGANQDVTAFTSRFYAGKLSSKLPPDTMDSFFASSLSVNHDVFKEDAEICARLPTDSWSPEPERYVCAGEAKIVEFRRVVRAHLEGRSAV